MLTREYPLDAGGIDRAAAEIENCLASLGVPRQDVLRSRLTLEELLLGLLDWEDRPETVALSMGRRLGRPTVLLRYRGAAFDPSQAVPEEES